MSNSPLTYKIEKDGDEYHAYVYELPGCHTHGKTPQEAIMYLKDAVQLYLECTIDEELTLQIADLAE